MIAKRIEGRLAHIVDTKGKYYLVDSSRDRETIVFKCDKKGKVKPHDYQRPLLIAKYVKDDDMVMGHYSIVEHIKEAIDEYQKLK